MSRGFRVTSRTRRHFLKVGAGLLASSAATAWGQLLPTGILSPRYPMMEVLTHLGLGSSLSCVLDFGDRRCYSGSGNTIYNIVNPAETWNRVGSLPFSGVAGRLSSAEYFSGNSSGYLQAAAGTTWDDTWNRATAQFSIAAFVQWGGAQNNTNWLKLLANSNPGTGSGFGLAIMGDNGSGQNDVLATYECNHNNGNHLPETVFTVPTGQWCFVGLAVDATTDTITFVINRNSFVRSYPALLGNPIWTTSYGVNPANAPTLFAWPNGTYPSVSNHRIACSSYWTGRLLSSAEFFSIYDKMKVRRFRTLP